MEPIESGNLILPNDSWTDIEHTLTPQEQHLF